MNVLVTGGGGFLGQAIVKRLLARGDSVRVLARSAYPELEAQGVRLFRGDVRDSKCLREACNSCEAVFHVAAIPGIWGSWETYHSINTVGTQNVVAACQSENVARLIYTSSPSVVFDGDDHVDANESLPYPDRWLCHYPHSKALGEQAVLAANCDSLKTISLRPHLIWGNNDNHLIPRLIQKARSGRLRQVGDGTNVVSVTHVENGAIAHVQAEEALRSANAAAGKAYFINDPEPVNLWEWINQLLQAAGLDPIRKSISAQTAYRIGRIMEGVWSCLPRSWEPPMTRFVALQLAGSHSYSIHAAQQDFGYTPVVTFEEGMKRLEPELRELGK